MKLDEVLQNGRKIQVLLRDEDRHTVLPTQVLLNKEDTFLITAPQDEGLSSAPIGTNLEVWVGCYDAHYTFEAKVVAEKMFKDLSCWELEKPPVLTVSDRRSFFRVKTSMLVKWQKVEADQLAEWENLRPTAIITLHDLCGAGLSFMYPTEIPLGSHMVFDIPLETESISINTTILGIVVRNQPQHEAFRVGVEFENVTKLQQHMIMQHLFSPWRRNIHLSSGF